MTKAADSSPPTTPATPAGARVLLVDDEPAISRSLARILGQAGHSVTAAHGGAEAIALLATSSFDVVISDIRMPGMDGLTLLRAIRAKDLDVPVAFMTGSPQLETVIEAMENGAFRYLLKPVDSHGSLALVERAAQLHRLARVRREAAEAMDGQRLGDRAGLEAKFASAIDKLWMAMQPILSWSGRSGLRVRGAPAHGRADAARARGLHRGRRAAAPRGPPRHIIPADLAARDRRTRRPTRRVHRPSRRRTWSTRKWARPRRARSVRVTHRPRGRRSARRWSRSTGSPGRGRVCASSAPPRPRRPRAAGRAGLSSFARSSPRIRQGRHILVSPHPHLAPRAELFRSFTATLSASSASS